MRYTILFLVMAACATSSPNDEQITINITPQTSGTVASLRGVSAVDETVAWASGARGAVLRTTDGGNTWRTLRVPNADTLDFRDIEAFDSLTAYVLSAGEDGRIYKTIDGGLNWVEQFRNQTKGAFFDCFDFWDANSGVVMSDPVAGKFMVLSTRDGTNWQPVPEGALPGALEGEAAFAASGTCLTVAGNERVYIASGGGAQARVFYSADRGNSWQVAATPVPAGTTSSGIFSLVFRDALNGAALGGDYQNPDRQVAVARTNNGGRSWLAGHSTGYVSGAAYLPRTQIIVAVGTPGTRVSVDDGRTWASVDLVEYNAVQFATERVGWAVGPRGRIARLSRN